MYLSLFGKELSSEEEMYVIERNYLCHDDGGFNSDGK
jgi:hypothetical protein